MAQIATQTITLTFSKLLPDTADDRDKNSIITDVDLDNVQTLIDTLYDGDDPRIVEITDSREV